MTSPQNMVPFFLAGDGAYLRFRTSDLMKLREKYGEPKPIKAMDENGFLIDATETYTARINNLVMVSDPIAIDDCLKAGLKQEDGRTPFSGISYEDLPFGPAQARQPILDALALGITGESYAVVLERRRKDDELRQRNERLKAKGAIFDGEPDPLTTLTTETLSSAPSGSDTDADS